VQRRLTRASHHLFRDCDPWYHGERIPGEYERPHVSVFTRHARVGEDVLQLTRAPTAEGAHRETGPAVTDVEVELRSEMRRGDIAATAARENIESGGDGLMSFAGHDLHRLPHDT
jgi:hypothetical protein